MQKSDSQTTVVACIIARMGSSRFPGKVLADIDGTSMLAHLIARLRRARSIDRIVLCTSKQPENRALIEAAVRAGADAIAGEEDDVVGRFRLAAAQFDADVVLRVTGDNVLTDPESIDLMVDAHIAHQADYTRTSGMPLGMTAEALSTEILEPIHSSLPNLAAGEYTLLYAFDPVRFKCVVLDCPESLRRPNYSVTVDTPEELEFMRQLFAKGDGGIGGPTAEEVVGMLDATSGYVGFPDDTPIKLPGGEKMSYLQFRQMMERRAAASIRIAWESADASSVRA